MSRVELAKIKSLTFYKDSYTTARRTSALPQVVCVGKPCWLFQPEVVRCVSLGGTGTEVDWKVWISFFHFFVLWTYVIVSAKLTFLTLCDSVESKSPVKDGRDQVILMFSKVWMDCLFHKFPPTDLFVFQGLVLWNIGLSKFQIPYIPIPQFSDRRASSSFLLLGPNLNLFPPQDYDWASIVFWIVWLGFIALILYSLLLSCRDRNSRTAPGSSGNNPPHRPNSGGWFPGDHHDNHYPSDPPPPYPKHQQQGAPPSWQNWRPGFWTGAALGGLANHWWNRSRNEVPVRRTAYDWERPSFFGRGTGYSTGQQPIRSDHDRGEGSSNLGPMRRSTGLGGSSVR